jgi:hexokinase
MSLDSYLSVVEAEFTVSSAVLDTMAHSFCAAMQSGLRGEKSSLKMLPSFLSVPSGSEVGNALAIDFGGTNLRVLEAQFLGEGQSKVSSVMSVPLIDPNGSYNYTSHLATGSDLFKFIVERLSEIAKPGTDYALGHTFSFPCVQTAINSASLIGWTKEIETSGVEGRDVGSLLSNALVNKNLKHIHPTAIINDTVGTLLSGAYARRNVDIASICGTGHNSCYLEPSHPLTGGPMIVNMESGNFDEIPRSRFDEALDAASARPGLQRLEKMVSGHYLGILLERVLRDMVAQGLAPPLSNHLTSRSFDGKLVSDILLAPNQSHQVEEIAKTLFKPHEVSADLNDAISRVTRLIAERSARLVAATFVGVVHHIDRQFERPHEIAIDGSLYEKMPGYAHWIQQAFVELSPRGAHISTHLAKDGSGLGAAIAAIVSS